MSIGLVLLPKSQNSPLVSVYLQEEDIVKVEMMESDETSTVVQIQEQDEGTTLKFDFAIDSDEVCAYH